MIFDITIENLLSYRDKTVFSMQGTDSKVKPSNFWAISEKERCLKVGMIYGANASGKTNFVVVLFLLIQKLIESINHTADEGLYSFSIPFMLDWDKRQDSSTSFFQIRFFMNGDYQTLFTYSIRFNRVRFIEESLVMDKGDKDVELFRRISSVRNGYDGIKVHKNFIKTPNIEKTIVRPNQLLMNALFVQNVKYVSDAARYLSSIQITCGYGDVVEENIWKEALPKLQQNNDLYLKLQTFIKYVGTGIKSIKVPSESNSRYQDTVFFHQSYKEGEIDGDFQLPAQAESTGTKYLFLLGYKVLVALENGYPIIIDELGASFHTMITAAIIQMFKDERINKKKSQLILTSHDIMLMDEKIFRKDQIWLTQKDNMGRSELFSLAEFIDLDENDSFKDWYMAHRFGGVPEIESLARLFQNA